MKFASPALAATSSSTANAAYAANTITDNDIILLPGVAQSRMHPNAVAAPAGRNHGNLKSAFTVKPTGVLRGTVGTTQSKIFKLAFLVFSLVGLSTAHDVANGSVGGVDVTLPSNAAPIRSAPRFSDKDLQGLHEIVSDLQDEPQAFDCSTIEQIWSTDHTAIEGTTLMTLKEQCEKGTISTPEELAALFEDLEGSQNPGLEDQIAILANDICASVSSNLSNIPDDVKVACLENPRNDDSVVDIAANFQDQQYSSDDTISADLADTCAQLEQYRSEIDTAMLALASSTERRLGKSSSETPVTGFAIGTDMISMYDCYCDTTNPANEGCTAKSLAFVEIITQAISKQAAEDFDPDNASNFFSHSQTNVEKHTTHLRQSGSMHASESSGASHVATLDSAVTRSMSELELGLCAPPGISTVPQTGGYSLCIYAGPVFECDISWDPKAANCLTSECGAGAVLKLKASVKICTGPVIDLEIKLCIDAVSEILEAIGRYITAAELFMNKFGIYSGCYRLAWAQYDGPNNRFAVTVGPHKYPIILNVFVEIAGVARMRFKGYECAYDDEESWFQYEYFAKYARLSSDGIIQDNLKDLTVRALQKWNSGAKDACLWNTKEWSYFSVSFRVFLNWGWFGETKVYSFARQFIMK